MANISPKYQKDYKNVSFQNPRVAIEAAATQLKWKRVLWITIGVIIAGGLYFVLYSPYFMIDEVTINGLQRISRGKLTTVVEEYRHSWLGYILPRNNLLFFGTSGLQEKIGTSYLLESLTITKSFPRKITIDIVEKKAQIAWMTDVGCYQLDDSGTIIADCDATTQDLIRIRDDRSTGQPLTIGNQPSSREEIEYLIKAKTRLDEQLHPKIFHVHADGDTTIRVEGDEHFAILLNATLSPDDQISRLYIMLTNEEIKAKAPTVEYFDLRFGEKIYYK